MRAALDGSLKGVIMGPNSRTRSVLRHYPLAVPGGGPRPVRSWEEPWGMERNTKEEQTKVYEDDCPMWRGLTLYIVREELRKGLNQMEEEKTHLGVEQPADPTGYMPEVVTFWKTAEWVQMKKRYNLQEQTFLQSRWGGLAKKPTTFAGTLRMTLPGAQEDEDQAEEKEDAKKVRSSKDLARWAPGIMMREKLQKGFKKRSSRRRFESWGGWRGRSMSSEDTAHSEGIVRFVKKYQREEGCIERFFTRSRCGQLGCCRTISSREWCGEKERQIHVDRDVHLAQRRGLWRRRTGWSLGRTRKRKSWWRGRGKPRDRGGWDRRPSRRRGRTRTRGGRTEARRRRSRRKEDSEDWGHQDWDPAVREVKGGCLRRSSRALSPTSFRRFPSPYRPHRPWTRVLQP